MNLSLKRLLPRAGWTAGMLWTWSACWAQPTPVMAPPPAAPPPNPPVEFNSDARPVSPLRPHAPTLYSIGDPTDEEQLYLEYINRARANPSAEGQLLALTPDPDVRAAITQFGVDLGMLVAEFNTNAQVAPLSFHPLLIDAARLHSGDMYTNEFQGHENSWDGQLAGSRVTAAGYAWSTVAENVFAYAKNPFHGHAGFEIDWGPGPGGMQTGRGHRVNIHGANYREVGIGVVNGTKGPVGPQLVTQNFASRVGLTPYLTGVAYYDLNTNDFYDLGEGLGGVTVTVDGVDAFAVTTRSGGFSVPVPGNGAYTVRFAALNAAPVVQSITVSGGLNLKVDHAPAYLPPVPQGAVSVGVGNPATYTITPVGGATNYEWRASSKSAYTQVEDAESGLTANWITTTTAGYSVVASGVSAGGTASYHLAHPEPEDQVLELDRALLPAGGATLQFASRLGWAAADQVARVELAAEGDADWTVVWSRAGTDTAGQTTFETASVPLTDYVGRSVRVRFVYAFSFGQFYNDTSSGVGWYFDNVRFTNTEHLGGATGGTFTGTSFPWTPAALGAYELQVRAGTPGRWLSFGPALSVSVVTAPVTVEATTVSVTGGTASIEFEVHNGTMTTWRIEARPDLATGWQVETGVSPEVLVPGSRYRFQVPIGAVPMRFFRIRGEP